MITSPLTEADLEYVEANFCTVGALCAGREETTAEVEALIEQGRLPRPAYVLPEGTGMFPADYFALIDDAGGVEALERHFADRHRRASVEGQASSLEEDWQGYLDGTYGVCLRSATPEAIVRKSTLVSSLCVLLVLARPAAPDWQQALREQVEELDALEREFAPDYDRGGRFGRLPTRDLLVEGARQRFPEVFVPAGRSSGR